MKVYVAKREYDYEGFTIIGIFTTQQEAQECCDNDWNINRTSKNGDSHDIEEHEIQGL